jgi:hypothetical protein
MAEETAFTGKIAGEVELPKMDVSEFVGKRLKVEEVKLVESMYQGKKTAYYKLSTEPVADHVKDQKGNIVKKDGKPLVIRASAILGLTEVEDGVWGWGKDTKTGKFLAKYKVKRPEDMKGVTVLVQLKANADGMEYLTIA